MNNTLSVAKREFTTFFASPIAYIVLGAFLLVSGWLFFATLIPNGQATMRGFFGLAPVFFMFLVPAITMRSLAEERKTGTLELLLTMPLEDWQIVLGKFLAALGMLGVGLLFTLPFAFTVASLTAPGVGFDWGAVLAGYLGLLFLAASFVAMGLWSSALSKNQIIGFIVGFVICFAFWVVDKFAIIFPESIARVLEYASVDYHFENIARGVLDSRDFLFYGSLTLAGLLFTTRTLGATRQ